MNVHKTVLTRRSFGNRKMIFGKIKELFFVGIGGSGMSGIAEILHNLGYKISGSDIKRSEITDRLEKMGVEIYYGHNPENIGNANVVVISSAVGADNPEVMEANNRGVAVIKRAEMLGELMRLKFSLGVAGTHGKTTTTSMLGKILHDAGFDPTVIVGGIVSGTGTGASLGSGDYMVAEADEYDKSFLKMFPSLAVVTNIEEDHLECYDDIEDLENSFVQYMNRVPFYGMVVYNADDERLRVLSERVVRPAVSFGFTEESDYRAVDYTSTEGGMRFTVFRREEKLGEIIMHVPGRHNAANALGAIAAAMELEISFETVAESLLHFAGVGRRFDLKGQVNDILVIDDFAHHPTEIKAAIETARSYGRRIIVIFQPHLFTRTQRFFKEFAEILKDVDKVFVIDIMPAREQPIPGVHASMITDYAKARGYDNFEYLGTKEKAIAPAVEEARPGDMILTIGAGSVTVLGPRILGGLEKK